ncbi:MAG: TIGR03862 family flavoprotein [Afipia sp.]|nr:TIGR03862 family flavoprotein [Afipia sp.]OJW61697.1 MAG: NAD(FAD)-utilizing dehydrogenase [Afipia sp. 64-13]
MAAETIASAGVRVTVYDRMPSVARKFLMAGRGGLNLTHSEPLNVFLARYGAAEPRLRAAIEAFPPEALRAWSEALGQPTFVGSSGRVFPQAFKASPLLRAWLRRLDARGVRFALRHDWTGWDANGALRFATPEGERSVRPDATLLALGGASWPRLGADGAWTSLLADKGIAIAPLKPANCGFLVAWSDVFRERFEGQPLKGVVLRHGECSVRGEAVVTRHGLEGGGIYALSASLRDAIAENGETILNIGLRPDLPAAALVTRLSSPRGKQSVSTFLRKAAGLSPVGIGLVQETAARAGTPLAAMPVEALAALIDEIPVVLTGPASIDRAISTAGGLSFDEIDDRFMLRRWPGVFVAGEMMDWEAPTGGYLLQACFATGVAAGKGVLEFLQR